jgi:hypothetical protein
MDVRMREHLFHFVDVQHVLAQPVAETRQFRLARRVVQDKALPRHPAEPHSDRNQARVLAAEAEAISDSAK